MSPIATRRDVFAGLALAAWSLPVVALAQGDPALGWAPKALTPDQARALNAAADTIYPATDTPGAIEAGVPQFVDRQIADWCTPTLTAVASIPTRCARSTGSPSPPEHPATATSMSR